MDFGKLREAACRCALKSRKTARRSSDARRACELSDWKNPETLDALAAAYAELGDFEKAVDWQKKAIELPRQSPIHPCACERLELYRR